MIRDLNFSQNISSGKILKFLTEIDDSFQPSLSSRINLKNYAKKLAENGSIFSFEDSHHRIIGAIILYCNDNSKVNAYIPILGVVKEYRGLGLIKDLFKKVENFLIYQDFKFLSLETWLGGDALPFYIKNGFLLNSSKWIDRTMV